MGKFIDLTGKKFNRLTVIKVYGKDKRGAYLWECKCDCGKTSIVPSDSLRRNNIKSCGCLQIEKIKEKVAKHYLCNTRLYRIWANIKTRCYNQKDKYYYNYGGRGIVICDEWKNNFKAFYDWSMANGYADNLTIDRINNDGNYESNNCRWATMKEQSNNTRRNRYYKIGNELLSANQIYEKYNIKYTTFITRLKRGYTLEKAITYKRPEKHYEYINGQKYTLTQISKMYNINSRTLSHRLEKMDIISAINYKRSKKS